MGFGASFDVSNLSDLSEGKYVRYTPNFAAPEQLHQTIGDIGAHTDLYALGVILLHCLGCNPWRDKSQTDINFMMATLELPHFDEDIHDGPFGSLLSDLLLKNISDGSKPMRLSSCGQVLTQLERIEGTL